jgi:hypothetical protein
VDKDITYNEFSPCFGGEDGNLRVTVTPSIIHIEDDLDDEDNPGELNLAFVLYTGDFKQSVRNQVGPVNVRSPGDWPLDKLPAPLSMCLNPSDNLVVTFQGWDDDDVDPAFKGKFNYVHYGPDPVGPSPPPVVVEADQTLRGVTSVFPLSSTSLPIGTGGFSDDMTIRFQISATTGCQEGLTGGDGGSSGSGNKSSDSDLDEIPDLTDNCPSYPNFPQKDSNGDGIGDVCDGEVVRSQDVALLNDRIDFNYDGIIDSQDICPYTSGPKKSNIDVDSDSVADTCFPYGIAGMVNNTTNSTIKN